MEIEKYLNHLHKENADGFIQLVRLENSDVVELHSGKYEDIINMVKNIQGQKDWYITPNTFYMPHRGDNNIRHFRALYSDIDLGVYSKSEASYQLFLMAYEDKIPMPTMIIDSGRGLHVYWRIQDAPMGASYTWEALQKYMYGKLKYLGADSQATDAARLLRPPGTINSKNGLVCKILHLDDETIYSMYDLRSSYLHYPIFKKGYEKPKPKSYNRNNDNHLPKFNVFSLYKERIADLLTLCKLRNYKVQGYRNMLIHCYVSWYRICIKDIKQVKRLAHQFNNMFIPPLPKNQVNAIINSISRNNVQYKYTNTTLIERLNITPAEQMLLKTIIGRQEKYHRNNMRRKKKRRNESGLTKRDEQRQNTVTAVKQLKKQGLKQVQIAKQLGISTARVSQVIKRESG